MSKNDNNTNVFIVTATFGNMMRFTNIPSIQHNYSNVVTAPTKLFEHVVSAEVRSFNVFVINNYLLQPKVQSRCHVK